MFQRKRRFRNRSNGRNHMPHNNSQSRIRSHKFSNGQIKGNFRSSISAEKSFEKYSALAKDAMSSGDKTLSENYLQHADHFMRIIQDKNRNRNPIKSENATDKPIEENKDLSQNNINQKEEIKK